MNNPESSMLPTLDPAAGSRFDRLVAKYYEDHTHPVNRFLHAGVGWPIMVAAVVLVPFHPPWSLALFVLSYAIMWFGHFIFERNLPTVFRNPTTPFVMAWAVVQNLGRGLARLLVSRRW